MKLYLCFRDFERVIHVFILPKPKVHLVTQQNNDWKHTSKSTSELLEKQSKMKVLERRSQSVDLNLIQMLWNDLKHAIQAQKSSSVTDKYAKRARNTIPQHFSG